MRPTLASALLLLSLTACSSTGETRADLSASGVGGHVQDIRVVAVPSDAPPGFAEAFKTRVLVRLKACATGERPLTLEADIYAFHAANSVKTYLVGDANEIRGQARLLDADNRPVGAWDIHRRYSGQDLYGAVAMRDTTGQMADAFANELCKQAFAAPGAR